MVHRTLRKSSPLVTSLTGYSWHCVSDVCIYMSGLKRDADIKWLFGPVASEMVVCAHCSVTQSVTKKTDTSMHEQMSTVKVKAICVCRASVDSRETESATVEQCNGCVSIALFWWKMKRQWKANNLQMKLKVRPAHRHVHTVDTQSDFTVRQIITFSRTSVLYRVLRSWESERDRLRALEEKDVWTWVNMQ